MSPDPVGIAHGRIEHLPRIHEFDIGQYETRRPLGDTVEDNQIIILERRENLPNHLLHGFVENLSDASGQSFTFSVEESSDNGVGDAYAGLSIRVGGTDVASVVVQPKGTVEFLIEGLTDTFLKFLADDQNVSRGRLVLTHFFGKLVRRHRELVP